MIIILITASTLLFVKSAFMIGSVFTGHPWIIYHVFCVLPDLVLFTMLISNGTLDLFHVDQYEHQVGFGPSLAEPKMELEADAASVGTSTSLRQST